MKDELLAKQRQVITDFVCFEAETAQTWPWAVSAEKLLQDEEKLNAAADSVRFDAEGCCDTDELYETLDRIFGVNPSLRTDDAPADGMTMAGL